MKIENFKYFKGQHCETTALGNLLNSIGIHLSEPMLFGLGSGLGYIFWNMKIMDFPFIGGRIKPDQITENLCALLQLKLNRHETASVKTAWEVVKQQLDQSQLAGLKLDCYHLDYFTNKMHFAAHYACIYGYDDTCAWMADTVQQGSLAKTTLENLAFARNEKGPMSSRDLSFTIEKRDLLPDLPEIIPVAIQKNASDYLNPPIKNIGYKGIEKTSREIYKWFDTSANIGRDFTMQAILMEQAGTGGALFRNLYRDFLKESYVLTGNKKIGKAYSLYSEIAAQWTRVSGLFHKTGETGDKTCLDKASVLLKELSVKERSAMEILVTLL